MEHKVFNSAEYTTETESHVITFNLLGAELSQAANALRTWLYMRIEELKKDLSGEPIDQPSKNILVPSTRRQNIERQIASLEVDLFDALIISNQAAKRPDMTWVLTMPQMRWLYRREATGAAKHSLMRIA
jgi:hypothetical protein